MVPFLFTAAILIALASANPLKDPDICGRPTCVSHGKFRYRENIAYLYQYSSDINTLFNGTSENKSTLHIAARISLEFKSPCEGVLKVFNVSLTEAAPIYDREEDEDILSPELPQSEKFGEAIGKHPLRFSFSDGILPEVCPHENETNWVLNFKKGILSAFQNTMKRFDIDQQHLDMDVNGLCETTYRMQGARETNLIIQKTKEISSCTHRYKHHSVIQSTPYMYRNNFQPLPIMMSSSTCEMSINHNIYNKIVCEELHKFQPFSSENSGALTRIKQALTLLSENNATMEDIEQVKQRSTLLFDHNQTPKPVSGELRASRDLIKAMCRLHTDDVEPGFPTVFTKFVHTARLLSYPALSQIYSRASSICTTGRKHVVDALPMLGSNAAIAVMRDAILKGEISKEMSDDWLFAISFLPKPDLKTITLITPLIMNTAASSILSVSSVVHTYCKWNANCETQEEIVDIVSHLEKQVRNGCESGDKSRGEVEKTLVNIKALGNVGVYTRTLYATLRQCAEDEKLLMQIRIAAIEAHRRLPCEGHRDYFLEHFRNQSIESELRIASYLEVMRCPTYIVVKTIKHSLIEEQVNQVGSFVWTHLTNLFKSSTPSRVEIQGLLQDKDLVKKFSSDVRKFSNNFESSVFFEDYNVGANYESNVIFSSKSYIPRSAMLNFTIDLFGESINLFEVAGHMEGFEHYMEQIFGPNGPFSKTKVAENIENSLEKLRFIRNTQNDLKSKVDALPNVAENLNLNYPKASLALKIFGNELKYYSFEGDSEIINALNSINPWENMKLLLSGKEINYNKASLLMDTSYVVPTGMGLPLSLSALGTAAVSLQMSGSLKASNLMKTGELDIEGKIRPSVAVDIVGTMSVDAYHANTGIKLKTNMYSSSAVEGHLKVRGKRLVSLTFDLPKDKIEIISAQSELVVMHGDNEEILAGTSEGKTKDHVCSWPAVDRTLGLKFCADYELPNMTQLRNMTQFVLTGPTKFSVFLQKADPTAKKYVLEYKWDVDTMQPNSTVISLSFDTPGSNISREMSARLYLDKNSQNLTLLLKSAESKFQAHGKYKNTEAEKYIQFGLKINGQKHFDAEIGMNTTKVKYGHIYMPKLYLGINDERIAHLSGFLKWIEKKGISQCDVNLEFATKKVVTKLHGYVRKSEASVSTNLKLNYQFPKTKTETVKIEGNLSNRSTRTLNQITGDLQVESSQYPHFNFISSLRLQRANGPHIECRIEVNSGQNMTVEQNKLTIQMVYAHHQSYEGHKTNAYIHITKPLSEIDLKLGGFHYSTGHEQTIVLMIRYATGKEIMVSFNLVYPRGSLTFIDAKLNVTVPSFIPMLLELRLHEKVPNEYDIDFMGTWFSGHTLTAKGLYQDRGTAKAANHNLKLLIKSPSFNEISLIIKFLRDDEEFKFDLQAEHNKDKYSLMLRHVQPSPTEFQTFIDLRYQKKVYTLTASVNLLTYKQTLLELHLDTYRDVVIILKGTNQPDQKEAGIEIKWDANRDPGQKFAAGVAFYRPEYLNYSGNFLVVYPGRTVKGDFMVVMKGSAYNSSAHLEWSDEDAIDMALVALYEYTDVFNLRMNCELLSPFENWRRTSIAGGVHYIGNLFHMNGSVHWQDDQSIALDLFGDYLIADDDLHCEFNATVLSTIEEVSSMAGGFYHKHGAKNVDTKIHLQYHPDQTITVHSMWEIERDLDWSNLTGIVNLLSPFEGYRRGELRSRIHISKEWELTGAAEFTLDTRKYTLTAEGHLKELTNSILTFNITTPFQNNELITGQLGYSEAKRHLVAQVMGPSGGLGIEVLLSIISTSDFDVKLSVATPMEFLQKALVVGKVKRDEVDFRCGWNTLVLGFSGIWHYENSTDFEYSYRIFTPLEGFEENGVVAKLIYKEGLDFQVALILTDVKLGIKVQGAPKPKLLKDLNVDPKLLEGDGNNPDYGEDSDEAEEEVIEEAGEALSWNGLVELDTVLYPTMRGTLEIDERGTVYHIVASIQFPDGVVHLHDEFDFIDYLTMSNRLHLTTPCVWFKELLSTYNFEFIIGEHYVTSLDIKVKSNNEWMNSGLTLNYTYEVGEDKAGKHQTKFKMFTPIEVIKLVELYNVIELHKKKTFSNLTVITPGSRFSTEGHLELREDYADSLLAFGLISPVYNIPAYKVQVLKDFASVEKKLKFEVNKLDSESENIKIEILWHYDNNVFKKGHMIIETPLEQLSHLAAEAIYVGKSHSTAAFDLNMELPQGQEVLINIILDEDILKVHLDLPIEGFRQAEIKGVVKNTGPGHKSLTAVLKSQGSEAKLNGTIITLPDMPLAIQLAVSEPRSMRIEFKIQKLIDGIRVASAVKRGTKDDFIMSGEYRTIPGSQWTIMMKVLTSHEIYKSFALNGKLLVQNKQNISAEITADTSIKGYENLRAYGNYLILKKSGTLRAAFDFSQVKGKFGAEWVFFMMENMGLEVTGSYETMNSSTHLTSEIFYKNPKKKFENFSVGLDLDINKSLWQFGTNFTLKFPEYNNVTVEYNVILPPPHAEIHKIYGKLEYENDLSYISEVLKYSTFHSRKLYGTFGKVYRKEGKLDGDLKFVWGKDKYKTILNVLKVAKEGEKHLDFLYTLTTPKYSEEETFVVKGSYDKEEDNYKVKGSIFCPASNFISGGNADFRSFYNMQGTLNTTTPFITIPYIGANFKAATLALHYQRFLEIFWTNDSALFDSQYSYENKNYNTQINGSIVVEVPLQNRHIGKLVYGYKEGPLHTTGYSAVEYNGNRFLEGKYNCDSQSSAGFEKDVIDIEIENEYSPLGIHYVHQFEYSGGSDGLNLPTTDMKRAELFKLNNRTEFNLTGEVTVHSTLTGQDITLTAIHMNRTIRLQTDYDFLDHEFKQRSVLHLDPEAWASYDITINNKTTVEKEEQHTELNFAYPKRNFTLLGYYQLSNNSLSSEVTFIWDKQARKKSVGTSFDWKRLSVSPNKHHAVLSLKHPSFKRDVTLNCHYAADKKVLVDVAGDLVYSTDDNKKLSLSGKLQDNSQGVKKHYNVEILGSHPATRLDLKVNGEVKFENKQYELNNNGQYKRSYLPLQTGHIKARLNTNLKEVEMERRLQKDLSYLKAKYIPANPIYVLNGSALRGRDLNATGEFMFNIQEKLVFGNINFTSDGSEAFHMYGNIPDARNAIFNIWRDYEEIRVSDVSFYLRLNHSRLVTSKLKWRPEIKNEILTGIHDAADALWNGFLEYMDYWRQYIKSETMDAVNDIWIDAKPIVQSFLNDVSELHVIADDFEEFKIYLNNSYNANEFYIRDIVDMVNYVIDELSLRGHIESLPNILKEVWEVMGESGEALRRSLVWIIETIKASYQKAVEFINGLLKGDSTAQITEMLEQLVEKYDRFIKDLHVAFLKHVENLWMQTSQFLWKNWYSFLRTIEPTFIKVLHYLESVVWKASKEILDFLYERRNDIVGSPYFSKIANLTADIEKIYKDFKNNDLLTNIKKYSLMVYEFLREKYFTMVPFGKELQEIASEIIEEFKELGKLPSIRYAIQKANELYDKVHWFYNSLDIGTKFQKLIKLIHTKLTEITNTALQTENKYREAKTKFIFDPENGFVTWEQKLPMSWHAFNETPKFEEIPEYRTLNDIQNYFVASNRTFWTLYYEYKPYTELSNWLPPFKAQAIIAGTEHFMTFDRRFFEFYGQCSYLLASDFMDHNFSAVITYDPNSKTKAYEIAVIIGNEVLHINIFDESVKLDGNAVRHLPLAIQDAYIYQEASIITIDSPRGFTIQCNLKFDVCTFTLTGWYFGKTAGILGTLDNEPSTDFLTSRNTQETELAYFAQSWSLEPQKCSSKNLAIAIPHPDEDILATCDSFFKLKTSQFSPCFPVVYPIPFWNMCINSGENSEHDTCTAAVAYMQACLMENTPLRIPDACVKCELSDGIELLEGDFRQLEGSDIPQSTDVVFIIEAKDCNKDLKQKRNMDSFVSLLAKELANLKLLSNRYAVVTFGGDGVYDKPRSVVVDNNIFATQHQISQYFEYIPVGKGNVDIFRALKFASKLLFRSGVSKTFILVPCSDCNPANTTLDYTVLHQVLLENDITLHILMNEEFSFVKGKVNKVFYGMDGETAYTKKDVKTLEGSVELRRQVKLPKASMGYCAALALETNGTVFTAKKLEGDKKNLVKKFAIVFAKRIAKTAIPCACQTCECTADNNGMSYMECFPCTYPSPGFINYDFTEDIPIIKQPNHSAEDDEEEESEEDASES